MTIVGWCDCWNDTYSTQPFTKERHSAFVDIVRKRQYNFSYQMNMMPYINPVYSDHTKCVLNKAQWDKVFSDAYADVEMPSKLIPMDVLTYKSNDTLWEDKKYAPKDGE